MKPVKVNQTMLSAYSNKNHRALACDHCSRPLELGELCETVAHSGKHFCMTCVEKMENGGD
jgi:hypothetical protein